MLARLYLQLGRRKEALVELAPVLAYHKKLGIPLPSFWRGKASYPCYAWRSSKAFRKITPAIS
jgi:hypothetical protein